MLGARTRAGAIAFEKNALRAIKIIPGKLDGEHYATLYDPVLNTGYIYKNPGKTQFIYENGRYKNADGEWEARALPLEKMNTFDAMWFAWIAFYPETQLYK